MSGYAALRNVRFSHNADITTALIHVRFLGVKRTSGQYR
jgi:hypothetical protein